MPDKPKPDNRPHTIRVDDELWSAAQAEARRRGEPVSEAIRAFLRRYVMRKK